MSSSAKFPFTRRRRSYQYFDSDEEDDVVPDLKLSTQDDDDDDGPSRRRRSDVPDGEIQMPNRAKLFHSLDDVVDFLPREKRKYLEDVEQPKSPLESDRRDMGLCRKDVPPTPTSLSVSPAKELHKPRKDFVYEFGLFEMIIGIGSILVFFADFGTDINLVVQYFLEEEILYGTVSLILTAGPSIVTCCLGLHWYILDYKREQNEIERKRTEDQKKLEETLKYKVSNCQWALRFLMTVLQLGPVMRVSEYLYYGYKSTQSSGKEKRRYHNRMLFEDVDACLLRLFESFLESAPQLTWQLYVWIELREEEEDVVRLSTRVFTLLSSWLALAVSLVSYHRSLRYSREEKKLMRKRAIPFYFIWRSSEVGNRVLCICLFASTFHAIVFIPVGIHWFVIAVWLMYQNTKFYNNRCFEIIFNIICGYVMIFCFLNLKEGHTRFRYILFYFIFYAENFSMLSVWFLYSSHLGEWFHVGGLTAVMLMAGLHIAFQLLYYLCCHPNEEIKPCLPCNKNTCFELLCHDLNEEKHKDPLNMEMTVKYPNQVNGQQTKQETTIIY